MTLDLSLMTSNGLIGLLQAYNVYSNGWFGICLTFIVPLIIFMITSALYEAKSCLLATALVLFIISLITLGLNLLSTTIFWIILTLNIILLFVALKMR